VLGSEISPSHVYQVGTICFAYLFVILLFSSLHGVLQYSQYQTLLHSHRLNLMINFRSHFKVLAVSCASIKRMTERDTYKVFL
jgi:hypothetical protein